MTELISNPLSGSRLPHAGFSPITVMAGGSAAATWLQEEQQQDARWAEWLAKGVRHDVAMRRRLQLFFYVVCLGLAAWLWWRY